jgi:hypothetical protein
VEAALILPLLFLLLFGVIEIGGVLKSYSSAANAVRSGGRAASVAGNDALADQYTMARMAQEAAGITKGEIEFVVIWHAAGPGESVPPACVSAAGSATTPNTASLGQTGAKACNVYVRPDAPGGAFALAKGQGAQPPTFYFGCTGLADPLASQKLDCNWSPKDRNVAISPRGTSPSSIVLTPDHLGVYIQAEHDYITGVLGSTLTITDSALTPVEPDTSGVGTSPCALVE